MPNGGKTGEVPIVSMEAYEIKSSWPAGEAGHLLGGTASSPALSLTGPFPTCGGAIFAIGGPSRRNALKRRCLQRFGLKSRDRGQRLAPVLEPRGVAHAQADAPPGSASGAQHITPRSGPRAS